jgi:hypothetical protein
MRQEENMRLMSGVLIWLLLMAVIPGCVENPVRTMFTEAPDSEASSVRVDRTSIANAPEITALPKDMFNATVTNGKLSWCVKVANMGSKRTYACGTLTIYAETGEVLFIDFGGTVEAAEAPDKPVTMEFRADDVIIDAMPKDWKIAKVDGKDKVSCVLIPGAGCETPTTRIAGNWPKTTITINYRLDTPTETVLTHLPVVIKPTVEQLDIPATKFRSTLTLKNDNPSDVIVTVMLRFTVTGSGGSPAGESGTRERTVRVPAFKQVTAKDIDYAVSRPMVNGQEMHLRTFIVKQVVVE